RVSSRASRGTRGQGRYGGHATRPSRSLAPLGMTEHANSRFVNPMDRLERLKARIKELPDRPGVYLHKDAAGEVIYVGKARNLRNRVGSYVVGKGDRDPFGNAHVKEIESVDFVTPNNELE